MLGLFKITSTNIWGLFKKFTNLCSISTCCGMTWKLTGSVTGEGVTYLKTKEDDGFFQVDIHGNIFELSSRVSFEVFVRHSPPHPVLDLTSPHLSACSPQCEKIHLWLAPPDSLCVWPKPWNAECLRNICWEPTPRTKHVGDRPVPIWSSFSGSTVNP